MTGEDWRGRALAARLADLCARDLARHRRLSSAYRRADRFIDRCAAGRDGFATRRNPVVEDRLNHASPPNAPVALLAAQAA